MNNKIDESLAKPVYKQKYFTANIYQDINGSVGTRKKNDSCDDPKTIFVLSIILCFTSGRFHDYLQV